MEMAKLFHKARETALSPQEIVKQYLQQCQITRFKKRQIVFRPMDNPHSIYLVLKGRVRVYLSYPDGKEFTITVLENGGVYSGHARGYGAALETSEIALIPIEVFQKIMEEKPEFMLGVVAVLGDALKHTMDIIENLAFRDVYERLLYFLRQMAERQGTKTAEGIMIHTGLTQEELATAIGSTRQTVSTLCKKLEQDGLIKMMNRKILLIEQPNSDTI